MNLKLDPIKNIVFFSLLIGAVGIFSLIPRIINGYIVIPAIVSLVIKFIVASLGIYLISMAMVYFSDKYYGIISGVLISIIVWWIKFFISIGVY